MHSNRVCILDLLSANRKLAQKDDVELKEDCGLLKTLRLPENTAFSVRN
jgi:hypothetical protein